MRPRPPRLNGMVHLLPLPGSPGGRPVSEVLDLALADAAALAEAGFDGLVVENFGDLPFRKRSVSPVTVAAMGRVLAAIRTRFTGLPLCVNVLRNDAESALALAAAHGAEAIRVNVHTGARLTDQGVIEGRAWETLRLREAWAAQEVAIWADLAVKHSTALGNPPRPLAEEAADLVRRGGADAVIVTGAATGSAVDCDGLAVLRSVVGEVPLVVGSGVSEASVGMLLELADAVIVGTSVKSGGRTTAAVDPDRARALVEAAGC